MSFKYYNTLARQYDELNKNVKIVTFNISHCGNYKHTINFTPAVSEAEAIEAAENYLSESVSLAHFEYVKDDLPIDVDNWEEASKWLKIKGDAIIITNYLYDVKILEVNNQYKQLILLTST